jgi:hypothetical protein
MRGLEIQFHSSGGYVFHRDTLRGDVDFSISVLRMVEKIKYLIWVHMCMFPLCAS